MSFTFPFVALSADPFVIVWGWGAMGGLPFLAIFFKKNHFFFADNKNWSIFAKQINQRLSIVLKNNVQFRIWKRCISVYRIPPGSALAPPDFSCHIAHGLAARTATNIIQQLDNNKPRYYFTLMNIFYYLNLYSYSGTLWLSNNDLTPRCLVEIFVFIIFYNFY